jgi:hypothetical protein
MPAVDNSRRRVETGVSSGSGVEAW